MKNAHERFGALEFVKRTKDTTTRVRVHIDRAVLETPKDERGQATVHLVSMIGGDAEIGALRAFWSTRYIEDVLGFAI
jgi:alkylhydroperoxidase/carboxymuconolactone decarboxylase family protein YurZ